MGYWFHFYWPRDYMTATTVEEAIHAILTTDVNLATLVGERIYPLFLPEDCDIPAICYQRISEPVQHAMVSDVNVREAVIQVSSFSTSFAGVKLLAAYVRTALSRYRGTIASVVIHDILLEANTDIFEPDTEIYHIPSDFTVFYTP